MIILTQCFLKSLISKVTNLKKKKRSPAFANQDWFLIITFEMKDLSLTLFIINTKKQSLFILFSECLVNKEVRFLE